jgi:PAS domain S-box-containing protein
MTGEQVNMEITIILIISILLQFAAAILALRLIWVTRQRTAWILIAAAILLMAIRRCVTLFQTDFSTLSHTTSLSAELIALVISLLMLCGLVYIAPLFRSLKHSEEMLRKAHDDLERRVKERTAELAASNEALQKEAVEREKTEEDLRQTRDYLDNLITYANAPIIVWNPGLEITRFNQAFERLTGRSAHEVLGKKLGILFPEDSRAATINMVNQTTMSERWEVVEIPVQHVDGSVRTVLWNSATIYAPDRRTPVATIAQGQDITELKKIDQMKDEFIGLVSHELRTPLTVITGSLQSSTSPGISPEDARELIQNAVEGADSLAAILDNMLELSRYQAGRLQLNVEPVDIALIARNVTKRLVNQGVTQRFSLDFPGDLPLVQADSMRVERILYNLLENATKYSPGESEIKVSGRVEGDFLVTGVTDHGKGISPEDRSRLFEPFQRLDATLHTRGVGLGLVVCKRLVEAQGGWIKVESGLGKYSAFSFALPLSRPGC